MKLECTVKELKELIKKDEPEQIICSGSSVKNFFLNKNQQKYQLFGLQRC